MVRVRASLRAVVLLACLIAGPAAPLQGPLHAQTGEILVTSIDFDGNDHFDGDRLKKFLSIKEEETYEVTDFDTANFAEQFEKLKAFYASEGFRGFSGTGVDLDYNGDSTEADLTIRVAEGAPTVIDTIIVAGNRFFTREQLLDELKFAQGDRYERQLAANGRTAIGATYKTAGYLDARVEVTGEWPDSVQDTCALTYKILEHTRFTIDSIRLEGLETVKPRLAEREFRFKPGEYVDLDALAESQRSMYETNLFRTVSIKPVAPADSASPDSTSPRKDINVRVIEEEPGKLELSIGFGSIDKVRGGALFNYDNTFGEGYRSSVGAKFSAIEQTISASLDNPRMFESRWGTNVIGTLSREDEPSYIVENLNGALSVYKKFLRRSRFSLTPSYEIGRYTDLKYSIFEDTDFLQDATPEEIEAIAAVIADLRVAYDRWGLRGSVQFDVRNNLLDPTAGVYVDLSSEFIYGTMELTHQGRSVLPATNRLVSSEAIVRAYQAVDKTLTIATSVETGLIVDLAESQVNFLLDDLFYAGGPTSLRGFDYKLVGPLSSSGAPLGGMLKLVWNAVELRKRIIGIFGAVAFFDVGNVWSKPEQFRWNEFRYSPGAGLRIDSPIGVVRFDLGLNPWPKNGEDHLQWWFGIGHAF